MFSTDDDEYFVMVAIFCSLMFWTRENTVTGLKHLLNSI